MQNEKRDQKLKQIKKGERLNKNPWGLRWLLISITDGNYNLLKKFMKRASKIGLYGFIPFLFLISFLWLHSFKLALLSSSFQSAWSRMSKE